MPAQPVQIALDRIEGDIAILDFGGELIEIPAAALPEGATEGSLLALTLAVRTDAIEAAINEAAARLERLRTRSPSLDDIDF